MPPIHRLLPDCRYHFFGYLNLKECLSYGSTSKLSLWEILPELQRRRKEQFLLRHAYQIERPSLLQPVVQEAGDGKEGLPISQHLIDGQQWHVLPSVAERIQNLYRAFPSSHPLDENLRELFLDLKETPDATTTANDPLDFHSCLKKLHKLIKAFRLHSFLLTRCTIKLDPKPCDPRHYTTTSRDHDPNSLTVLLEHYIGDVLCACYLMGHSIAGLVEGGPKHGEWTSKLLSKLEKEKRSDNTQTINPVVWYQLWIYLHSALLRNFPFSPSQQQMLGISASGIYGATIPESLAYIHPHYPYMGTGTSVVAETSELVRAFTEQRTSPRAAHRTTFHHFGPLGPAFRGRDRVQTNLMDPGFLVRRLQHPEYVIPSTWFLVAQKKHIILDSPAFHSWFTSEDDVVRWMLELKQECGKTRPMTVMPPLVTIELLGLF